MYVPICMHLYRAYKYTLRVLGIEKTPPFCEFMYRLNCAFLEMRHARSMIAKLLELEQCRISMHKRTSAHIYAARFMKKEIPRTIYLML